MNGLYGLLIFSTLAFIMSDEIEKEIIEGITYGTSLEYENTYKFFMNAKTGMNVAMIFEVYEDFINSFPQTISVYEYPSRPFASYNYNNRLSFTFENVTLEGTYFSYKVTYSTIKGTTNYVAFEINSLSTIGVTVKGYIRGSYTPISIDYDLEHGIEKNIGMISSSDIYKFYLPVKLGQIGEIKIHLPSKDYYSFDNLYIYEYSNRNSLPMNKDKYVFSNSTDDSKIIFTASKTVNQKSTKYFAFQFSSYYNIENLDIFGNASDYNHRIDGNKELYYYLESGTSRIVGDLFPENTLFIYLPIMKDQTAELIIDFSLSDDYDYISITQPFIIYECSQSNSDKCEFEKSFNFYLKKGSSKTRFSTNYKVQSITVNYLKFKIKPKYNYYFVSIMGRVEKNENNEKNKNNEKHYYFFDFSEFLTLMLLFFIIIIFCIYCLIIGCCERNISDEIIDPIDHDEIFSSSEQNQNLLPNE